MIELKDGGKYVRRDGKAVTVTKNTGPIWVKTHPFRGTGENNFITWTANGIWNANGNTPSQLDLVSEYTPPFTISAGNYYRTRDGRKAYVACGPTLLPQPEYEDESTYYCFGIVDNPDDYESFHWSVNGREDHLGHEAPGDLVAPWHPETLTDPTTGKKYRVAEEVT